MKTADPRLARAAAAAARGGSYRIAGDLINIIAMSPDVTGGVVVAMITWIDDAASELAVDPNLPVLLQLTDIYGRTFGIDDTDPRRAWAAQLIAARLSGNTTAWAAALDQVPEDPAQAYELVFTLLRMCVQGFNMPIPQTMN